MRNLFTVLAIVFSLLLHGTDYDCVFIGSSPISLFEALYQYELGNKVLVLEEADVCGGVWKSIEVCGVEHVDVGCHEIGSNKMLKEFLEVYGGCTMITSNKCNGFYFSKGCYELVHNLEKMIAKTTIEVLLGTLAERATLDEQNECIVIEAGSKKISTGKVYMSGYSFINIGDAAARAINKSKYYHLYLLIADSTPPNFSYQGSGVANTSRMMNLTRFVGLENTGRQLIVLQTHKENNLDDAESFLEELKKKNLVDPAAYILKAESYVYEQWPSGSAKPTGAYQPYFETLQTYDFRSMTTFFPKWKQILKPYSEIIHD